VVKASVSKSYLTPLGNEDYIRESEKLIFGPQHSVIQEGRVISAQCPGAGGGLRLGAELLKRLQPGASVWFSDPVWDHQIDFFTSAGLEAKSYHYYDSQTRRIDFGAMLLSLSKANAGDMIVIHACCHNPTGADLSLIQWQKLTELLIEKQLLPFVDIAYQGYGSGIEEDVLGMQTMASQMDNMLVTLSSSKSFAVYRDRTGLLSIIHASNHQHRDSLKRYFRDLIRGTYFMPPDHAAAVVAEILMNEDLKRIWREELDGVRARILGCRRALAESISKLNSSAPTQYLIEQKGMFSCFALSAQQLEKLESEFGIYLLHSGRINFAAMTKNHAPRIAHALDSVQTGG